MTDPLYGIPQSVKDVIRTTNDLAGKAGAIYLLMALELSVGHPNRETVAEVAATYRALADALDGLNAAIEESIQ